MSYEQLPENIRAICEGRRLDLTPAQFDAYASYCRQAREAAGVDTHSDSHRISETPAYGAVGTQLKAIFESIDIQLPGCLVCGGAMRTMNVLGPDGCRAQFVALVGDLRSRSKSVTLRQRLRAAAKAICNGLAFKLNPLDPTPGLLREAIRRAETEPPSNGLSPRTPRRLPG